MSGLLLSFIIATTMLVGYAQDFARGYVTRDDQLRPGMVVGLSTTDDGGQAAVERATRENSDKIIGVSAESGDTLVTIASGEQQVYVQTSGEVVAFVSDINGQVHKDDNLTISPLKGVLMRSDSTTPTIGLALENFKAETGEMQEVTAPSGIKMASVGKIRITLDPLLANQKTQTVPSPLERLGQAVAGRKVEEIQVVVALIIFLVVLVAEGSIIYGAVSSGLISLGRNPMAKSAIKSELVRVVGVAMIVLFVGLAAMYGVLRI